MENKNRAAFPSEFEVSRETDDGTLVYSTEVVFGLTKREYFAAMAMQGILANHWCQNDFNNNIKALSPEEVSNQSILYADALLNQLDKQQ